MTRATREASWVAGAMAIVAGVAAYGVSNRSYAVVRVDDVVYLFVMVFAILTGVRSIAWGIRRQSEPPAVIAFWREAVIVAGICLLVWAWSSERYDDDVRIEMVIGTGLAMIGALALRGLPR